MADERSGGLERIRARLRHTALHRTWRRAQAAAGSRRVLDDLAGVETYCLFLGHSRSGHSIVGALLDAHPEVVISDELDALSYVSHGFSREQVLYLSVMVARHQASRLRAKQGRGRTYSYHVPGQHQGAYRQLRVVGDSRAGWTTRRLSEDPALLERVERRMAPSALRFIHVTRNPFDNISTMMIRGGRTQEGAMRLYFAGCDRLAGLRRRIPGERLLTLRHEDVITSPRERLAEACRFLGVEADEAYLDACAAILFRAPSRSRDSVEWSQDRIAEVHGEIGRFDFLEGYGHAT
jgi:Sulfotransferase family